MLISSVLAAILSLSMSSASSASSVALQWDPNTESDLAGYKVYYAADSTSFDSAPAVDVQNRTATTIAGLDPAKSYSFAVKAYNSSGMESSFSNVVVVSELSPPAVAIASPAASANVSGTVTINASASDNLGVARVEFYVNDVLVATEVAPPYVYSWDTSSLALGTHTLAVKAYDAAGNVGQASETVTVGNDTSAPTIASFGMTSSAMSLTVAVSGFSAGDNVGVTGYLITESASAPSASSSGWSCSAPTGYTFASGGTWTAYAWVRDAAGNVSASRSATTTITLPTVTIDSPVEGTTVSGIVAVRANVSGGLVPSTVLLYVDGGLRASDTEAPFSCNWNTRTLANGSHAVVIRVYDSSGNILQASATVAVKN